MKIALVIGLLAALAVAGCRREEPAPLKLTDAADVAMPLGTSG